MAIPLVIECADHKFAPYVFTCIHLANGVHPRDWRTLYVDDGREVEYDCVCVECYDKFLRRDKKNEALIICCINCFRDIMKRDGVECLPLPLVG